MVFKDRAAAGRRLAESLQEFQNENPIVLALPRGGVPVGYEVARTLNAPLDVMIARKLGAPGQPELGIGAIAPGGVRVLNEEAIDMLGIREAEIEAIAAEEERELARRLRRFRGDRPPPALRGRTVILVDDGLATGVTAKAAIRAIRKEEPRRIIFAVPVCASDTARSLSEEVDELVCLEAPPYFGAVGLWYQNFEQTSDEEVLEWLERAREKTGEVEGREAPATGPNSPVGGLNSPAGRPNSDAARSVTVTAGRIRLQGDLRIPAGARGIVLFAHGSGSSRFSPRNRFVADVLHRAGLATFLLDLLTAKEESIDRVTAALRFNIGLLAERLVEATDWVARQTETGLFRVGYFGSSTGAAAALIAAARRPDRVGAIVSRGGRPDLAGPALSEVRAPTLLIVGGGDRQVIELNKGAMARMRAPAELKIIPGATHLFEEPGALEQVARMASDWFVRHLDAAGQTKAA
ncbi:MAG: dienelactone hydrolase family protein [Candidatus Manganitrophus sp. SA1]|nr:dienelactone hydrolase family protein [Candidatus Manganitrophus morganii]